MKRKLKAAKPIGQCIREAREAAGLGQIEASRRAGISQAGWCQIETGLRSPRFDTLEKIATALGVSVRDLIPE